MPETIAYGDRKTRAPHYCYDCKCLIPPKSEVGFYSCVSDGSAYTLYMHKDCRAAAEFWRDLVEQWWPGGSYIDEGYPPLLEDLHDCGEFEAGCDALRGHFPHVVARMELRAQKQAIRHGDWQAYG